MNALSFLVVLSLIAPSSSISCNGSKTFSIPSMLCSPKYRRLASSSASCHKSCQSIATLISSFETNCACVYRSNILIDQAAKVNKMKKVKHKLISIIRPDPQVHHCADALCQPLLELLLCANCLWIYTQQEEGT